MAYLYKNIRFKILELLPLFFLFYISLNGSSIINFNLFSIQISSIVVYYWVLRRPQNLGYGFIFLSGIFNDVNAHLIHAGFVGPHSYSKN